MPRSRRDLASKAWNVMGGEINWSALPVVVEMLGIDDVETFIAELHAIGEWNRKRNEESNGHQA